MSVTKAKRGKGVRITIVLNEREQDTIKAMRKPNQSDSDFIKESILWRMPIPEILLRWKIHPEALYKKGEDYAFEKHNQDYCKGVDDTLKYFKSQQKHTKAKEVVEKDAYLPGYL